MTEMILIVEIDCKTTIEMSIRRKIINIREGLEIIVKTLMKTGTVGININTNTGMTAMTEVEMGLIVGIGHEATKKMTIEMIIEMKIIETRDMREDLKTIIREVRQG